MPEPFPAPAAHPTELLLARARGGDRDAYDALFSQAADRLQIYLRVRLGPALRGHEESRDLLQETYLAAHRAFPAFEDRGEGAFVRWLCRIAENQIRARADHHHAQKRLPPGELERATRVLDRLAAAATGPVTAAGRSEQRERLAVAMAALPADEREALLQRHFEGRELDEIAQLLGTSATSVRRLLGRATLRLADRLGPGSAP
ncbi:MAG: sigma-70 family RNA polymerase sigma factor [Planctomycetes bacterium]|jgi:RNA polymerase sigma-70 factor (ECF subfamily)|nr:sigma-70 family RNA polymerase sigma factor [Planctomycetota bacterium]